MGVNAPGYLILPKVIAAVTMIPLLIVLSISLSIGGGILVGDLTGILPSQQFIDGARSAFKGYNVFFLLTKAFTLPFNQFGFGLPGLFYKRRVVGSGVK